jgi:hypothetical protein
MKTVVGCTVRLGWKTTCDEELEQSRRALPKNLICPLPYRIAKASGFGDLLSRSPVHASAQNEIDYGGGASSEKPGKSLYRWCSGETLGNVDHAHVARPSRL